MRNSPFSISHFFLGLFCIEPLWDCNSGVFEQLELLEVEGLGLSDTFGLQIVEQNNQLSNKQHCQIIENNRATRVMSYVKQIFWCKT